MRSGLKKNQRQNKRQSSIYHNHRSVSSHAASSSDNQTIASPFTNLKGKRKKLKARKKFKRLSRKQKLAARNLLAQKRIKKQSVLIDLSGPRGYTTVHEMSMADETLPTVGKCRQKSDFKKFHNNTERRLKLRKNRLNQGAKNFQIQSNSQRASKKLLRAIKVRHLKRSKRLQQISNLKRILNLPKDSSIKEPHVVCISIEEEGVVISDDEDEHTLTADNSIDDDDDDDCICIEPQIEEIVIDDDKPDPSSSIEENKNTSGCVSFIQRTKDRSTELTGKLLASTPVATARYSTQNADDSFGDLSTMFFEDVSSMNTLDTNTSEDTLTKYSKICTLLKNSKLRSKSKNRKRKKSKNPATVAEDVIILDDTVNDCTNSPTEAIIGETNVDDSVIFISETVGKSDEPAQALDFVPLHSDSVPNPIFVPISPTRTPRRAAINSGLFTNSEKKQLTAYNNNAYNPNAGDPQAKEKLSGLRLILIDGCNVAFNHALNKEFSVKGLKICIDYFEKMGHEVKAVVPQFRLHRCTDTAAMFELHRAGKIVVTPCKNLPGKFSSSYDDRFILQLAAEMDAVIVSNDNYRDLINENSAFKKLIENRVIGFTWCNDLFMVAKDPYGKWGPSLQTILKRV